MRASLGYYNVLDVSDSANSTKNIPSKILYRLLQKDVYTNIFSIPKNMFPKCSIFGDRADIAFACLTLHFCTCRSKSRMRDRQTVNYVAHTYPGTCGAKLDFTATVDVGRTGPTRAQNNDADAIRCAVH